MEFEKIVQERYATKSFDGRSLPDDKVAKLFEIIRNAASSYNIQPWVVRVITKPDLKEKLSPASWNFPARSREWLFRRFRSAARTRATGYRW